MLSALVLQDQQRKQFVNIRMSQIHLNVSNKAKQQSGSIRTAKIYTLSTDDPMLSLLNKIWRYALVLCRIRSIKMIYKRASNVKGFSQVRDVQLTVDIVSRLQSSTRCAADISQTTKLQGIDRSPPYHELALDVGISNSLAVILGTKKKG